mgnify:CR=1 FL=1
MSENLLQDAVGYVSLLIGLVLVWLRFDWLIALIVLALTFGVVSVLGTYVRIVSEHLLDQFIQSGAKSED